MLRKLAAPDIVGPDGKELGGVAQVLRGPDDKVDRLLVELDGGLKDRYIHAPITGLKTVVRGDDTNFETPLTKAEQAALPEVKLPAP